MRGFLHKAYDALPWLFALFLVGLLGFTWARRLPYPYDLEWMEGGMLAHAWRLSEGLPLYVEPNPDFVPYIYPPGYSALVALFSVPFGLSPTVGRALSLLGTLAAAGAIAWALRQERAPWGLAVAAGAVFLGTYRGSGAFYDLVRPDGLYVGFLAWSVVLAWSGRRGTAVASGLLLAASFTMKHNAAAFGLPLVLVLLARGWRPALAFTAASAGPALGFVGFMQWRSGGHFLTYLLEVPRSHPTELVRAFPGTPLELGTTLPIALVGMALWLVVRHGEQSRRLPTPWAVGLPIVLAMVLAWFGTRYPARQGIVVIFEAGGPGLWALGAMAVVAGLVVMERGREVPWRLWMAGAVAVMALLLAAAMRAHNGGFLNVHAHLFWAASFVFGLALVRMPRGLAVALVCGQIAWGAATTRGVHLRPTVEDRAAGDRMVEALRGREGPVLAPYAAWLPTYAGHPPSLHYMGVWDLDYKTGPYVDDLRRIRQAVQRGHWPVVLMADEPFPYGLREHYRADGPPLVPEGRVLRPKTGWPARPERLLVPKGR